MKKSLGFFFLLVGLLTSGVSAQAATAAEQINAAIGKGDFKTVQTLVAANPGEAGKTVTALLQATLDSFYTNLGLSQKALELASTLAKGLDVNNPARSALAEKLQKIVQLDVLKACPACQDKGNEKEGQNKTNLSAEEREKVKTMRGFMKRVETMAQLPIVVAASPQLFVQAQEFGSMCGEGGDEDIQLAQTPSTRPPRTPPQKERASED